MGDGINMGLLIAMIKQASGADPEQIEQFVKNWLNDHPEATTTVQDGSITLAKLAADLAAKINSITQLSDEIEGIDSDVTDLKSALNELEDTQKALYFNEASVSGTRGKSIQCALPAGTYTLYVGNLVSSDTSQNTSNIKFVGNGSVVWSESITRRVENTKTIILSSDVDTIDFYGKNQYNDSAEITFTYSNVKITANTALNQRIANAEDEVETNANLIDDIFDKQIKVLFDETVAGTRNVQKLISIPAGNYLLKIDSVDSTDTEYNYSRITFYVGSTTNVLSLDIPRAAGYNGKITLAQDIDTINFYGATSYANSAGVVFSFNGMLIGIDTELNRRFEQLDNFGNHFENPYQDVIFSMDTKIKTTTHDHCGQQTTLDRLTDKGLGLIAISNYYPSEPFYTLADKGLTPATSVLEIPNAEQHGFTNLSGSCHMNSIGSMFSSGKPLGETPIGVNDIWQHGLIKIKRGFLIEDGGGITINHPVWSNLTAQQVMDFLDYDPSVIGIEIFNQSCEDQNGKGWALDMWDTILKTGRRCLGFAVPDHVQESSSDWKGTITLYVPSATQNDCLKAIRKGAFYSQINHTSLSISDLVVTGRTISVTVSENATIKIIVDGETISTKTGVNTATFTIPSNAVYCRLEISTTNDTIYTNPIMYKLKAT